MTTNSLKVLLTEIIDYAGLFPPSEVSMSVAVRNFAEYLKSENAWMLGRFIVPINRLKEFSTEAESYLTKKDPWRLSILANTDLPNTLKNVADFNLKNEGRAVIDTLEIKVNEAIEIVEANKILPRGLVTYFEIPPNDILSDFVTALALSRRGAKIRTGGVSQETFPSTDSIIKFMRICIAANIPFKATAGLHHPLRTIKPLTYEPNAPNGTMHGFFNLFLSACILRQNLNSSIVHKLMNETTSENFVFEEDSISWNNQFLSVQDISQSRLKNAISFGSCSFSEPIEDLKDLKLF
jgi:hypothetical protein